MLKPCCILYMYWLWPLVTSHLAYPISTFFISSSLRQQQLELIMTFSIHILINFQHWLFLFEHLVIISECLFKFQPYVTVIVHGSAFLLPSFHQTIFLLPSLFCMLHFLLRAPQKPVPIFGTTYLSVQFHMNSQIFFFSSKSYKYKLLTVIGLSSL